MHSVAYTNISLKEYEESVFSMLFWPFSCSSFSRPIELRRAEILKAFSTNLGRHDP